MSWPGDGGGRQGLRTSGSGGPEHGLRPLPPGCQAGLAAGDM